MRVTDCNVALCTITRESMLIRTTVFKGWRLTVVQVC